MNIYNTNKRTSRLVSKGFALVSYPSITYLWISYGKHQMLTSRTPYRVCLAYGYFGCRFFVKTIVC